MLLPILLVVDPISWVFGEPPNFAQAGNGSVLSVVSRAEGRGARAGALVDLYYPQYAADQLVEATVGLRLGDRIRWAHELRLTGQRLVPDSGLIESTFAAPGISLAVTDLVRPSADVHVRRVTVFNSGAVPLEDISAVFRAHFVLGGNPADDRLRLDVAAGRLVQHDARVAAAIASDRPVTGGTCGPAGTWPGFWPGSGWSALWPPGSPGAAALTDFGQVAAGPWPGGVAGSFATAFQPLAPGASASVTFAVGLGRDEEAAGRAAEEALAVGWDALRAEDRERWAAWLGRSRLPARLPADVAAVSRRALVTLGQLQTTGGGVVAAPTGLSPPYRFVWPRDSTFVALGLLEAGYAAEAARAFEFLEGVQSPDGGWEINYIPDGSAPFWDLGPSGNETDQPGVFPWGVQRVFAATGDAAWLHARWGAVRKACDYLLRQQRPDGLIRPCRDLWELDVHGSWTFSNGAAFAGLRAGAAIASRLGHEAAAASYQAAAGRLKEAIARDLVVGGRLVQGLGPEGPDTDVEAANLALGTTWFGVFAEGDDRMRRTADAVAADLRSSWGGVRRYTGDTYYGGEPWPVTTGWLALYRLATGDRLAAEALLGVMTRYARHTDSLLLGEQFDEARGRWVSAFPLAWSAATYLTVARRLFE